MRRIFLILVGIMLAATLAACESDTPQVAGVGVTPQPGQSTATPVPTTPPQATTTATPPAQPPAPQSACRDGEQMAVVSNKLDRSPLGTGDRWSINEVSWVGKGFGGLQRAVVVLSPLGGTWAVHIVNGMTARVVAFCGTGEEVSAWAVKAHAPSLRQASQAPDGSRPSEGEIPVYWLDFAGDGKIHVVKDAPNGPSPDVALAHLEVSRTK